MYFALCLQVMRHPEKGKRKHPQKKKSIKICFAKLEDNENTGVEEEVVEKCVQTVLVPSNEKAFKSLKTHHFEDVVCQLAQLCLVHMNDKKSERHLVFLSLLLRSFHTPRVFSVSHLTISMHFTVKYSGQPFIQTHQIFCNFISLNL